MFHFVGVWVPRCSFEGKSICCVCFLKFHTTLATFPWVQGCGGCIEPRTKVPFNNKSIKVPTAQTTQNYMSNKSFNTWKNPLINLTVLHPERFFSAFSYPSHPARKFDFLKIHQGINVPTKPTRYKFIWCVVENVTLTEQLLKRQSAFVRRSWSFLQSTI